MKRRSTRKTARNQPRQRRSRATVTDILDAAIRVLEQGGWDALTTSRGAEVAGVSDGTVYQYFAHREAIVEALQGRELARATQMLESILKGPTLESDRQVARAVVEGLFALYRAAPALHRVLAVEGLRLSPPGAVEGLHARIPRVTFETIPTAAHSLHWEAPQSVAAAIRGFLR